MVRANGCYRVTFSRGFGVGLVFVILDLRGLRLLIHFAMSACGLDVFLMY